MALWLPTDERRLLAGYFFQIGEVGKEAVFREQHLCEWLYCRWRNKKILEYGDPEPEYTGDDEALKRDAKAYIRDSARVRLANKHLAERGLIKVQQHESEISVVVVSLTLEGYDLGRQYSSLLKSSGLWFQEYKAHWIWLIAATIGGGITGRLLDFMASLLFKTK